MNHIKFNSIFFPLCAIFSFGITFFRLFISFISFLFLLKNKNIYSHFLIYTIILIMILDQIDGKIFKKSILNDSAFWKNHRRILDSICDRICIQLFCIPILFLQPKFIIIYTIIIWKEMMTSIKCIKAYNNNIILSSNNMGKISSVTVGIVVIMWILHLYFIAYCITPIILITGYISYKNYLNSYKKELNRIN